jgi:hypothetical protein
MLLRREQGRASTTTEMGRPWCCWDQRNCASTAAPRRASRLSADVTAAAEQGDDVAVDVAAVRAEGVGLVL